MKKFKEHSKFRQDNLVTLRDGVKRLYGNAVGHPRFQMSDYVVRPNGAVVLPGGAAHGCGTAMCLAGHGPMLGIWPTESVLNAQVARCDEPMEWGDYVSMCFTGNNDRSAGSQFDWLFDLYWPDDPSQAIKRLDMYVGDCVPKYWRSGEEFS